MSVQEHIEGKATEYSLLRQELLASSQFCVQLAGVALPVIAAVAAFGYLQHSFLAILGAMIGVAFTFLYIVAQQEMIIFIASYLYTYLEVRGNGLHWEHAVYTLRKKNDNPNAAYFRLSTVICIFIVIALGVYGWYILPGNLDPQTNLFFWAVAGGLIAIQVFTTYRTFVITGSGFFREQCKKWQDAYNPARDG